jgi:hypothetical protein
MTYSYHPQARKELDDATDYYDRIDPQLGDDFLKEIDDCISRILRFPRAWTKLRGGNAFEPKTELLGWSS